MKKYPPIRVLFLDLNGTCVDDWESSYAGVRAIFDTHRKPLPSIEEYISAVAQDGGYHKFYEDRGVCATRDELYEIYQPAYYAHMEEVVITPELHMALNALKNVGVEIHLISAARGDFAQPLVEAASLTQYCESMHFHVHDKAAQIEAIIRGMEYVKAHECAMIGDLPSDVLDSKKAGIKGIAFLNRHVPRRLFAGVHQMDLAVFEFKGILPFVLGEN